MKKPGIIAAVAGILLIAVILSVLFCLKRSAGKAELQEGYVVYIGTYGNHFYRYIFDQETGSFTPLGKAELVNPSYIALGEENMLDGIYDLYAASEAGAGSGVYSFADDIMLTRTGSNPRTGHDPCFLFYDRESDTVMTADYGSGSVSVFDVGDDGSVGALLQSLVFRGSGPVASRQESSHIHQLKFLPRQEGADARYLLASDLGADRIRVMKMPDAGQIPFRENLPVLSCLPECDIICGAGSGPRHMEVDTLRRRLYCLTELSGELLVFDFSFDCDGRPVFDMTGRFLADDLRAGGSADIHLHPSGDFLYTSHRLKKDGISVFSIAEDGSVTKVGYCRTGKHPRNFAITPDGKTMLVACRDDRSVEAYEINPETGMLSYTGSRVKFAEDMPSCVRIAE